MYDKFGEEGLKQQGGFGQGDPFDVFRNAFGGQQFGQQARKGQNKMTEVEVTLESIYQGDSITVSLILIILFEKLELIFSTIGYCW